MTVGSRLVLPVVMLREPPATETLVAAAMLARGGRAITFAALKRTRVLSVISHARFTTDGSSIGNTIIHLTEPRIVALLDWELATLGHPLADLAYFCMSYDLPAGIPGPASGLAGLKLNELGIPSEDEFIATYQRMFPRADFSEWQYFRAFAFFRMAAIFEGVYAQALQGNGADPAGVQYGEAGKVFAAVGWKYAQGVS